MYNCTILVTLILADGTPQRSSPAPQAYASHTDSNLGIERTDSCGSAIAREICA